MKSTFYSFLIIPLILMTLSACGSLTGSGGGGTSGECANDLESCQDEILTLVNEERSQTQDCGTQGSFSPVDDLVLNDQLSQAAQTLADDFVENLGVVDGFEFGHVGSDGSTLGVRVLSAGYEAHWSFENAAYGSSTPEGVMNLWMNSDGHCANVMVEAVTELGVGYAEKSDGTPFWVQVLALPCDDPRADCRED